MILWGKRCGATDPNTARTCTREAGHGDLQHWHRSWTGRHTFWNESYPVIARHLRPSALDCRWHDHLHRV